MGAATATLGQSSIQEVIDLHRFFQTWLDGSLPQSETHFRRFTGVADPAFTLIGPDGGLATFADAAAWIFAAHATRPGVALWSDEHTVLYEDAQVALITYCEWQRRDGATTVRRSTALFLAAPGQSACPNGVRWRHVHETWL